MNSSDYWRLYKEKKEEVEDYEDDIKKIKVVITNLGNLSDEVTNVNKKFDELEKDLKKAVRHNATFVADAENTSSKKEESVGSDCYLKEADACLDDAITNIETLKEQAEEDRDEYYKQYQLKKAEEEDERRREAEAKRKAAEEALKDLFGGGK